MLTFGEESIRDVMAFPKNNRGMDLMSQSPADVDPKQLREFKIKLDIGKMAPDKSTLRNPVAE